MPKQKRDYEELKKEFMKSNYFEVKEFITDKGLPYNSDMVKRTKGRTKDKKAYKEKTIKLAINKSIERQAEKLSAEIDQSKLAEIKQMIFDSVYDDVKRIYESDRKDYKALETYSKMTKIELKEPTNYTKSENENTNTEKIESINILWDNPKDDG